MSIETTVHYYQYKQNEEKSFEFAKLIQAAAKEVHAEFIARIECQELCSAQRIDI